MEQAIIVFMTSFGVSALAGFAAMLRTGSKLTIYNGLSAFLNSGLLGLSISLLWYLKFQDNLYFLVGVCVIAGLGGMATFDFILKAILERIGINTKDSKFDETVKKG